MEFKNQELLFGREIASLHIGFQVVQPPQSATLSGPPEAYNNHNKSQNKINKPTSHQQAHIHTHEPNPSCFNKRNRVKIAVCSYRSTSRGDSSGPRHGEQCSGWGVSPPLVSMAPSSAPSSPHTWLPSFQTLLFAHTFGEVVTKETRLTHSSYIDKTLHKAKKPTIMGHM